MACHTGFIDTRRCARPKFPCFGGDGCYSLDGVLLADCLHDVGSVGGAIIDALVAGSLGVDPPIDRGGGGGGRSRADIEHDIALARLQLASGVRGGSPEQRLDLAKGELRHFDEERQNYDFSDWAPSICGAYSASNPLARQIDKCRFIDDQADAIVGGIIASVPYVQAALLTARDITSVVVDAHLTAGADLCRSVRRHYRRLTRRRRKGRRRNRTKSAPGVLGRRRRTRRPRRRYHSH